MLRPAQGRRDGPTSPRIDGRKSRRVGAHARREAPRARGRSGRGVEAGPSRSRPGRAHDAILSWCNANGYKPAGPSWEIYGHWQDEWNSKPAVIRTNVFYQIVSSPA